MNRTEAEEFFSHVAGPANGGWNEIEPVTPRRRYRVPWQAAACGLESDGLGVYSPKMGKNAENARFLGWDMYRKDPAMLALDARRCPSPRHASGVEVAGNSAARPRMLLAGCGGSYLDLSGSSRRKPNGGAARVAALTLRTDCFTDRVEAER